MKQCSLHDGVVRWWELLYPGKDVSVPDDVKSRKGRRIRSKRASARRRGTRGKAVATALTRCHVMLPGARFQA